MKESTVEYRQLGHSGLRVSVPIFGMMGIGTDQWRSWVLNEDKALPLLKAAWDRGINTFDTANIYSNGESERVLGKFIKQYEIPRNKIMILTKIHHLVHETDTSIQAFLPVHKQLPDTREYVNQSGLSRAAIFNTVDACLERLGSSYIDLLQIHLNTPIEETMEALNDLVRWGKVRYIGASSMRAWRFAEMNKVAEKRGWSKFVSMQDEYSLLYREEEREMIPYCKANGIGIIPWSPLAEGFLARPLGVETKRADASKNGPFEVQLSIEDRRIIENVEELAKRKGWSMAQVALAWICSKVTSPIVGINSLERLNELFSLGKRLADDDIEYLELPYSPKTLRGRA